MYQVIDAIRFLLKINEEFEENDWDDQWIELIKEKIENLLHVLYEENTLYVCGIHGFRPNDALGEKGVKAFEELKEIITLAQSVNSELIN